MPKTYEVIVGNIGTVYEGPHGTTARAAFREYVHASKQARGRAGGEQVTMFEDGEPVKEYVPADWETTHEINPFGTLEEGIHTSMTFGVMPGFGAFEAAFDARVPTGIYEIRNSPEGVDGDYTAEDLYGCVERWSRGTLLFHEPGELTEEEEEEMMTLASVVMETLGFEWI